VADCSAVAGVPGLEELSLGTDYRGPLRLARPDAVAGARDAVPPGRRRAGGAERAAGADPALRTVAVAGRTTFRDGDLGALLELPAAESVALE
jgi:hypothetical protein